MSSILDALNKLEQEKAQAAQTEQSELDPAITAHDLVGRSVLRDRVTLRVTPAALLLSVTAIIVTLVVVVFAVATIFARPSAKPEEKTTVADNVTLTASPEPATVEVTPPSAAPETPPQEAPPATTAVAPQTTTPTNSIPEPEPAPPPQTLPSPQASSFVPPIETATSPSSAPSPSVVARQPDPKTEIPATTETEVKPEPRAASPVPAETTPEPPPPAPGPAPRETTPAVKEEPAPRTRVAAVPLDDEEELPPPRHSPPVPKSTAAPAKVVAVDRLPEFTPMEQSRYGLERVKINIMKPADATNPRGSAIISFSETSPDGSARTNRMRFFEGERIQQSPLRMFKVEKDRVGLEDVRTGDRYQLQF